MLLFPALLCTLVALTQAKTRIVGGSEATYGDFPYICSLQNDIDDSWMHSCGSVIWNNDHLITAAHCVGDTASFHRVVCGLQHLNVHDQYRVTRSLSSFLKHPGWDPQGNSIPNDIAVLKLSSPLTFNSHVNKITFAPEDSGSFEGESCVLSGWGLLSGGGTISETLQEVNMTAITNTKCSNYFPGQINDGHVCYFRGEGYDACSSDSGGPAVCGNYLAGITSWGMPSCDGTSPAVYTRISYHYDWLVNNAGIN